MFAIFPEIMHQTVAGDIEAVTCLVRKYFADGQVFTPNLRVADLCANAEIKVRAGLPNQAVRMEAWDANGQFRIEISVHPDIKNQRELNFILALMLGHVFLDLQPKMVKGELQRSIFEKRSSPLRELLLSPNSATDADLFAASLLLPKAMVKKALASLKTKADVAAFFNVDLPLLEFRLLKLGLVSGASAFAEGRKSEAASAEPKASPRSSAKGETKSEAKVSARAEPKAAETKGADPEGVDPKGMERRINDGKVPPKKEAAPSHKSETSSVARVIRSTAARGYRKESDNISDSKEAAKETGGKVGSPGLERLRQLARKIDKSVSD